MDLDIILNTNREGLGHLLPPLMPALSEGYGIGCPDTPPFDAEA